MAKQHARRNLQLTKRRRMKLELMRKVEKQLKDYVRYGRYKA